MRCTQAALRCTQAAPCRQFLVQQRCRKLDGEVDSLSINMNTQRGCEDRMVVAVNRKTSDIEKFDTYALQMTEILCTASRNR